MTPNRDAPWFFDGEGRGVFVPCEPPPCDLELDAGYLFAGVERRYEGRCGHERLYVFSERFSNAYQLGPNRWAQRWVDVSAANSQE